MEQSRVAYDIERCGLFFREFKGMGRMRGEEADEEVDDEETEKR